MAALRVLALAAMAGWAAPAAADPVGRWSGHIAEASLRFGIPQEWIRRVMRIESGGHTVMDGRPIVSRAGAMGLMQLMPGTWRDMRTLLRLGRDPHDPRDNILAGAAYLRAMYDRFGYPGLFAAYNAGPARYAVHLATGHALPAETRAYVRRAQAVTARPGVPTRAAAPLFAARSAELSVAAPPPANRTSAPDGLFVQLSIARR